MKLINYFILFLVIVYLLKLNPLINGYVFGEPDAAYNAGAVKIIMQKGGNPISNDFLIANAYDMIINRTYACFGEEAGYLKLISNDFDEKLLYFVLFCFIIITALMIYYFYDDNHLTGLIVFSISLFSIRSFLSVVWGQWAFITSTIFVFTTLYFYKKFKESFNKKDFILTLISLFISIQAHAFCFLTAFFGIISLLINDLINKRLNKKIIKWTLTLFLILAFTQLISINSYKELLKFNSNTANTKFSLLEAFQMNNSRYGYPKWYFQDYITIWGISLLLMPLGFFYSFKKRNYTYILWFLMVFILSRPSLISYTHVQVRLSIILPLIGALIAGDGFRLFKNNKIIAIILIVLVVINFWHFTIIPLMSPEFVDVLKWINNNLKGEIITFTQAVSEKTVKWSTVISGNKFFQAKAINNQLILTNYTDYLGTYNITYLVSGFEPQLANVVYSNKKFVVIKV